jgi:oligopeptide transport system permease protein
VIGVAYGAVAGYLGGRVDMVMMRIVDVLYSLPFIFFVILLVVFFGRNFVLMFIAIGAIEWLDMARIVRGQTLSIKRQEFVQAAEALGVTNGRASCRHIIPNRSARSSSSSRCWCRRSSCSKASCPSSAWACRSR